MHIIKRKMKKMKSGCVLCNDLSIATLLDIFYALVGNLPTLLLIA